MFYDQFTWHWILHKKCCCFSLSSSWKQHFEGLKIKSFSFRVFFMKILPLQWLTIKLSLCCSKRGSSYRWPRQLPRARNGHRGSAYWDIGTVSMRIIWQCCNCFHANKDYKFVFLGISKSINSSSIFSWRKKNRCKWDATWLELWKA